MKNTKKHVVCVIFLFKYCLLIFGYKNNFNQLISLSQDSQKYFIYFNGMFFHLKQAKESSPKKLKIICQYRHKQPLNSN